MTQKWVTLAWLLVIIVAVFVRFYGIKQLPTSLNWDEVSIFVDVSTMVESGTDMHGNSWLQAIYPSWGDYKLPGYILAVWGTAQLLGLHQWIVRIPSALAGLLTVVTGGGIAYSLFSKNKFAKQIAWWSGLVIATSPWDIIFSRSGFEAHLSQALLGISALLLLNKSQSWMMKLLAVLVGAASVYTYYSTRFVWPIVFGSWWLWFGFKWHPKQRMLETLKQVGLGLLVPTILFFILLQPLVKSPLYQPSQQFRLSTPSILNETKTVETAKSLRMTTNNSPFSRLFYNQEMLRFHQLAKNVASHLSLEYLFFNGDQNLRHGTGVHGLFLLVWMPFFCIGILKTATKYKKAGFFLGVWTVAALIPASVPTVVPHALRSLNSLIPLSILIGVGVAAILEVIERFRNRIIETKKIAVVIILLAVGMSLFEFMGYYLNRYPITAAESWSDGFQELADRTIYLSYTLNIDRVLVHNTDGRLPLRFLASGFLNSQDGSDTVSGDYLFKQLGRFYFTGIPTQPELLELQTPTLLVTHSGMISSYSDQIQDHIQFIETVRSSDGQERGTIALYKP